MIYDLITKRIWHHTDKIGSNIYCVHVPHGRKFSEEFNDSHADRINFAYPGSDYDSIYVFYGHVLGTKMNGEDYDLVVRAYPEMDP